jgi:HlyD family secretion protein
MDIQRPDLARKRRRRRLLWAVGAGVGIALLTLGVSQLEPAAPAVDRASVWIDEVERGGMVRQVRGPGSLVPEQIRWVSAPHEGRVEAIRLQPGSRVEPGTVLLELSNPELEQQVVEAETELRAAEADLADLAAELEAERLSQESVAAQVASDAKQARLRLEADDRLAREGLLSDLLLQLSRLQSEELAKRAELEAQRIERLASSTAAQLAARRVRLEQLRALHRLRRDQVAALDVQAGIAGVLQQVPVEVGQRVSPGTILARVADPRELKAELRIPETQAKDVQVGLTAEIDTRNGVVAGRVVRVDPAVENGTVTVDVALQGPLPRGARPDLSVDGTIEIERLEDVLYVGRPAYGQPESTVTLFKLAPGSDEAVRVPVRLGRSSVNTIEVEEGLVEGDRVILSDISQWDGFDRIRLE